MTRFSNIVLITALSLAPAAAFAAPAHTTVATERTVASDPVPAPTPATDSKDASRYADREQKDPKAADYKGGSVVIVASGTAILIALLILIIIL